VKKGEPGRKHNLVIGRGPHAFQAISGALLLCKPAKKQHSKVILQMGKSPPALENQLVW